MEELRKYINKLRHDFGKKLLTEADAGDDPFRFFNLWFHEAVDAMVNEPNAMVLSTVGADSVPSSRIVLLRNFDEKGIVFYTNYNSEKAKDLRANNSVSLLFFWPELERQVRLEGIATRQSESESDQYFSSRPRSSQIGAWVSAQSAVIGSRDELDIRFTELSKKFEGREVSRPPHWGGFLVDIRSFEFWQGRPNRLHDRILFTKSKAGWTRVRLAP